MLVIVIIFGTNGKNHQPHPLRSFVIFKHFLQEGSNAFSLPSFQPWNILWHIRVNYSHLNHIVSIGGYRPGQARALPWLFTCETPPSPPTLGRACNSNNEIHVHNCGEPHAVRVSIIRS